MVLVSPGPVLHLTLLGLGVNIIELLLIFSNFGFKNGAVGGWMDNDYCASALLEHSYIFNLVRTGTIRFSAALIGPSGAIGERFEDRHSKWAQFGAETFMFTVVV